MGIEKLLFRINNCRKDLNSILKNTYQNELKQIQFGKFLTDTQALSINQKLIKTALINKKINDVEYNNFKINQKLAIEREKHAIIYLIENGKTIFFITKTSRSADFDKPIKDEMMIYSPKELTTVLQLFKNKNAYLSNSIYVLEFKNESELNNAVKNIENDEMIINHYFKDYNLRLQQKEIAFQIFYKHMLKEDPAILNVNNIFEEFSNSIITTANSLVDVTFSKYVEDNVDRISNYEGYRKESWISYLKSYEIEEDIKQKNDSTDI